MGENFVLKVDSMIEWFTESGVNLIKKVIL